MRMRLPGGAFAGAIVAVAFGQTLMAAPPKPPGPKSPTAIEGWCNENGGTYFDAGDGIYGCYLPGDQAYVCDNGQCWYAITVPPRKVTPPIAIDLDLLSKVDSLSTTVGTQLQSISTAQGLLTDELANVQQVCTTPPDLVPLPVGAQEFSRCDGDATLGVLVHNQGGTAAPASRLHVYFRTAAVGNVATTDVVAPTPTLAHYSSSDVAVPIPAGCFDAGDICQYKIVVDGQSEVAESNETNNSASGQCVRPIG